MSFYSKPWIAVTVPVCAGRAEGLDSVNADLVRRIARSMGVEEDLDDATLQAAYEQFKKEQDVMPELESAVEDMIRSGRSSDLQDALNDLSFISSYDEAAFSKGVEERKLWDKGLFGQLQKLETDTEGWVHRVSRSEDAKKYVDQWTSVLAQVENYLKERQKRLNRMMQLETDWLQTDARDFVAGGQAEAAASIADAMLSKERRLRLKQVMEGRGDIQAWEEEEGAKVIAAWAKADTTWSSAAQYVDAELAKATPRIIEASEKAAIERELSSIGDQVGRIRRLCNEYQRRMVAVPSTVQEILDSSTTLSSSAAPATDVVSTVIPPTPVLSDPSATPSSSTTSDPSTSSSSSTIAPPTSAAHSATSPPASFTEPPLKKRKSSKKSDPSPPQQGHSTQDSSIPIPVVASANAPAPTPKTSAAEVVAPTLPSGPQSHISPSPTLASTSSSSSSIDDSTIAQSELTIPSPPQPPSVETSSSSSPNDALESLKEESPPLEQQPHSTDFPSEPVQSSLTEEPPSAVEQPTPPTSSPDPSPEQPLSRTPVPAMEDLYPIDVARDERGQPVVITGTGLRKQKDKKGQVVDMGALVDSVPVLSQLTRKPSGPQAQVENLGGRLAMMAFVITIIKEILFGGGLIVDPSPARSAFEVAMTGGVLLLLALLLLLVFSFKSQSSKNGSRNDPTNSDAN
eukprot:CAMPEP_0184648436 /NCGR_PEP_ID=MMETSP0308-20130426/5563_1 /TAXON_ID=38269 /ORGANISM="Gloeochaete witrockiana, Strain SAG 46.84" /LENGTH=684 /DNA_ID=CAMNT_0027080259 /DNA_START=129 /DNA_END=2183 /DNA_ORIENTATION=+